MPLDWAPIANCCGTPRGHFSTCPCVSISRTKRSSPPERVAVCAVNNTGLGVRSFAGSSLARPAEQASVPRVLSNHAHASDCFGGFACGRDGARPTVQVLRCPGYPRSCRRRPPNLTWRGSVAAACPGKSASKALFFSFLEPFGAVIKVPPPKFSI
jgi:hypothetical protein